MKSFTSSRMGITHLNGNSRRPPNIQRVAPNDRLIYAQHDDLIKYIYESWMKVEMDRGANSVIYYQEDATHHLKDFQPFDLEAYWGRRLHQNHQHS